MVAEYFGLVNLRKWGRIVPVKPLAQKKKARGKTGGRAPIDCWLTSTRLVRNEDMILETQGKLNKIFSLDALAPFEA